MDSSLVVIINFLNNAINIHKTCCNHNCKNATESFNFSPVVDLLEELIKLGFRINFSFNDFFLRWFGLGKFLVLLSRLTGFGLLGSQLSCPNHCSSTPFWVLELFKLKGKDLAGPLAVQLLRPRVLTRNHYTRRQMS